MKKLSLATVLLQILTVSNSIHTPTHTTLISHTLNLISLSRATTSTCMYAHVQEGCVIHHTFKLGAFTLLTSRFLKSRHFDPTIYTCAKNREVSVSRNFAIFWLVVRMCDHRLQCMHSCMQRMQYA